ncbi:UNKNOWN [Stylonychia lemnae]|uniref:C2 NT-type domain-containing protein n=1 Tax=Stylonychia lemnae TaxID=5949 RepID=A0A078ANR4_STYLE|nr:UNKNOWN [Stylonychia lemnae]|eukprot:CDW82947.1 UNKNOWN [Stylonychia lemnae]
MTSKKGIEFEISIRAATINSPDQTNLQVLWIRGPKKIDTRVKQVKDGKVAFNEKFQMKTAMEIGDNGEVLPKPTTLQLIETDSKKFLGECILDLAKYCATPETSEKLKLEQCEDDKAYIEIRVRAKESDDTATPSHRGSITQRRKTILQQDNTDIQSQRSNIRDDKEEQKLMNQLENLLNEIDLQRKQNQKKQQEIEGKKQSQNDQYAHLSDIDKDKLIVLDGQIKNKKDVFDKMSVKTKELESEAEKLKQMTNLSELMKIKMLCDKTQREHDQFEKEIADFYDIDRFQL